MATSLVARPAAPPSPTRTRADLVFEGLLGLEALALALVVARGSAGWSALRVAAVVGIALAGIVATRRGRSARRAAARGLVAVGAGVVGVVVGLAIGVSFTVRAGISPTGLAGLVCLLTGSGLLGWGTVVLVRRTHGWRRWLALPVGFLVLQFVVVPLFGAVVITNVPPDDVEATTPADRGLPYEDVRFTTPDGAVLSGWYVPSRNRAAVVMLAGSGSTRSGVLEHAVVLARHGYGVLLVDNRGHGRSDGAAMDTGWFGTADIAGALTALQARADVDPSRLGVVGMSMGGEEAIGAAAEDPRIRAVVAEGATARDAADSLPAPGIEGVVERITSWEQFRVADLLTDASRPPPLRDAAATAPAPMLLIAGRGEIDANRRFRDAGAGRIELWELPDTPHVGALAERPDEWARRVTSFLDRTLAA